MSSFYATMYESMVINGGLAWVRKVARFCNYSHQNGLPKKRRFVQKGAINRRFYEVPPSSVPALACHRQIPVHFLLICCANPWEFCSDLGSGENT